MNELKAFNLTPTLVGGAVRDFFLNDELGSDWDLELTHNTLAFERNQWKDLSRALSKLGRTTILTYDVIRLELKGYSLEFSPPRKEIFEAHLAQEGHRNFSVEFDFKMPFEEAVRRRDFTINAMGFRFSSEKEVEFLDPLEGLRHLREKILHPAGPDFSKDPVRFLRALRFAQKYNLTFSPELEAMLHKMDSSSYSPAYLWSEMQKSGDPLTYLKKLSSLKKENLPVAGSFITQVDELRRVLRDPSQHENWIIALEWVGLSSERWQQYFSLSGESRARMGRWAHDSKSFQQIMPELFHGEFETVRSLPEFDKLFDWYFTTKHLLQKYPKLPLLQMIDDYLPQWVHLYRFEPVKDVKHIEPPFRAKYQVWNLCQRL